MGLVSTHRLVLAGFLGVLFAGSHAWPNAAGDCDSAEGGHTKRSPGTGGYRLTLLQQSGAAAGHIDVLFRLADEADGAPLRGFVVRSDASAEFVELPPGVQHLECQRGGRAVTHTARAAKPVVELRARVPVAAAAGGVAFRVIAMPAFEAWFGFEQALRVVPGTDPPRLEIGAPIAADEAPAVTPEL